MSVGWLVGFFIGGLIPTFIVSRLTLMLVGRGARHTFVWLLFAHALSLFLCALLYGFGSGRGGFDARVANMFGPGFGLGLSAYFLQQTSWLIAEYFYRRAKVNRTGPIR